MTVKTHNNDDDELGELDWGMSMGNKKAIESETHHSDDDNDSDASDNDSDDENNDKSKTRSRKKEADRKRKEQELRAREVRNEHIYLLSMYYHVMCHSRFFSVHWRKDVLSPIVVMTLNVC